ncbi:MAG: C40 family peptidase [Prevotellaceae bacterium]|nr:C40 family peptidase [Prevotellaceae bacterium]
MYSKKILTFIIMLFIAVAPTFADNDKEETDAQKTQEIDNYDFLYNEDYDSDFSFASVDEMLDEAFSHLGARYRAGMSGPSAFDCSGFTSYVFKNLGIELNRSSRAQYTQGDPVEKENLQSGDLVFFTSPRSGKTIGHVGIVVDVDPMNGSFNFIHASRKGVKVSSSDEAYYSRRYVGARRVK